MTTDPEQMWDLLHEGSEDLADELGLAGRTAFSPASLAALDEWLAAQERPLDEEIAAQIGFFLARVLVEAHRGGLAQIAEKGHPLEGEWAITGFESGLDADFHVPFLVSATRLGEGTLTARDWYEQVLREGRGERARPRRR